MLVGPVCLTVRTDAGAAFAEADRCRPRSMGPGAEGDFVAVLEECAGLPRREPEGIRAVVSDFQQTPVVFRGGSGNRAAAQQITGAQIATSAGVMGDELRGGPIHVPRR